MKQDIRNLFKNKELNKKELPLFHEDDFLDKLNDFKKKKSFFPIFKIAASIVLLVTVGYHFLSSDIEIKEEKQPEMFVKIQQIEKEYLKDIENEWNSFITITNDSILVNRYKEKLTSLDLSYQENLNLYKSNKNNLVVIEALIENLKTRLQLLKDIQQHINLLNKEHENTTI